MMNSFICKLPTFGIIEIKGEDTASFLQAQFTGDIQLAEGASVWSAWCNAQGRVIASFIVTRTAGHYYLILPADMTATFCHRLKMYVLRARVLVQDITEHYGCIGANITKDEFELNDLLNWDFSIFRLAVPNSPERHLWITARNEMPALFTGLAVHGIKITEARMWQLQDITSGLPWIHAQTSEEFLPQELNLDMLGGLSYNKGCYPGQEIIARLHFRGRQKRRLCSGHFELTGSLPVAGTKLSVRNSDLTAGIVLDSTHEFNARARLLAVIETDLATAADTVLLEDGTRVDFMPIPVPADNL